MDAPETCDFTEEFRQQELERGRRSYAYFLTAICGLTAADPDTGEPTLGEYHWDMCSFLEGRPPHFPYNRAVICAFRGGTKSVTVMMYLLWRCLYIINLSALILSNSSDNARDLHFLPLINILTSSRRAEYIRWLYQHRFPPNMAGTTTEHLILIRTDPLAEVTISYAGMESKLEGKHPGIIWCHQRGTAVFDGSWMKVEEHPSFKGFVTAPGRRVQVWGLPHPEIVTADHRYWAMRIQSTSGQHRPMEPEKPGWVEAAELDDRHWIGHPIDTETVSAFPAVTVWQNGVNARRGTGRWNRYEKGCESTGDWTQKIPEEFADPEWWWLIGLWWGDGHLQGPNATAISISNSVIFARVTGLLFRSGVAWSTLWRHGCYAVVFCRTWLNRWLRTWKRGNAMKTPPAWVEALPSHLQDALIEGYVDADGYRTEKETRVTSVHLEGLLALRRMYARQGRVATIRLGPAGGPITISGRETVARRRYDLRLSHKNARYEYYQTFIKDGFLWSKVKSVEKVDSAEFAPITTDSGTYLTAFGMSHNCDDPEGADAEKKKSTIPNEASYQLWQRVQFLPRYPVKAQIILTATPWGKKPLVWRLRDLLNWQSEADNATSSIKFFWRPIRKNGKSVWPERFPDYLIDEMLKDPLARTQLLLERSQGDSGFFDMAAVTESFYQWLSPDKTAIVYKGYKFDLDKLTDQGFVKPELTESVVKMRQLRFFIHFDPLHRTDEIRRHSVTSTRPAKAGIVVVGVGPDAHAFVIDDWAADADLYGQATELFRLYRMYCPSVVTFESIGAQVWLLSFVKSMEDQNPQWARPMSAGLFGERSVRIPKLSHRLTEADKTTQSKEWLFREGLSPWLNHGALHLRSDQRELYTELEAVLNENLAVDRVDCLAQGPSVWKPGMADTLAREWQARRQYVDSFVKKVGGAISHTGWRPSGWRRAG